MQRGQKYKWSLRPKWKYFKAAVLRSYFWGFELLWNEDLNKTLIAVSVGGLGLVCASTSALILPPFSFPPHASLCFFHPPSSQPPLLGSATAAEGVTHLLMRAAIDFSLTPRLWEGVDGVEPASSEKPFASVERAAWSMLPRNCKKHTQA